MILLIGGDAPIARAVLAFAKRPMIATTRRGNAGDGRPPFDLRNDPDEWNLPKAAAVCILARAPPGNPLVNVERTRVLIDRLHAAGAYVLFLSTDRVFDGRTPRSPAQSPTAPTDAYGREKAAVEQHVAGYANTAILRLGKVLQRGFPLFAGWRESLRTGLPVEAFVDLATAPVPMELVARVILRLLESRPAGIFQLSAECDLTYFEIASRLAGVVGAPADLVRPAQAPFPRQYVSLDSSRLVSQFGLKLPDAMDVAMEAAGA